MRNDSWKRNFNKSQSNFQLQQSEKAMNQPNMVDVLQDAGLQSNPQLVNGVQQVAPDAPLPVQMSDTTDSLIQQVQAAVTASQAKVIAAERELEQARAQLNANTGAFQLLQQVKQQGAGIFAPVIQQPAA